MDVMLTQWGLKGVELVQTPELHPRPVGEWNS